MTLKSLLFAAFVTVSLLAGCASPYWTATDASNAPVSVDRNSVLGPRSATEDMLERSPRTDCAEQVFGTGTMPMCR